MKPRIATFMTAHTVRRIVKEKDYLNKLKNIFNELNIEKVYIENYRSGLQVTTEELRKARKLLENEYEVSGGTCIGTWGEDWGRYADYGFKVICLTDNKNLNLLAKVMRQAASVFDEILIDDFWANWCYCDECISRFNEQYGFNLNVRSFREALLRKDPQIMSCWADYSTKLLTDVSKRYVVGPAKEVNRDVKVILKVAEWRENFHFRGLFFNALKNVFDGFYVGTESREGTQRYGSFYIIEYVRAFVGNKLKGAWFDTYNGYELRIPIGINTYLEQGWHSALGLVDEITLFNARALLEEEKREHFERMGHEIPLMKKLCGSIKGESVGLIRPAIQPSSQGAIFERYLEDALGMIGVPLKVVPLEHIKDGDYVLITEEDIGYIDIFELIERGCNLVVSSMAAELIAKGALGESGLELLGLSKVMPLRYEAKDIHAFVYKGNVIMLEHRRPSGMVVGPILNLERGRVLAYASDGKESFPVIYISEYKGTKVYVLCVTKYMPYLKMMYPEIIRQVVRDIVLEYLGVGLVRYRDALFDVSVFPYTDGTVTLMNMNDYGVTFDLVLDKGKARIEFSKVPKDTVLGKAKIEHISEDSEKISMHIRMPQNSIDAVKFA